jgi:hypothetical protein
LSGDYYDWDRVTNNTGVEFGRIIFINGTYLATSSSNKLFRSTDLTNWTSCNFQFPTNHHFTSMAYGNGRIMVVGTTTTLPYKPIAYISDPLAGLDILQSCPIQLSISGIVGATYRIEYVTNLASTNWQVAGIIPLTNNRATFTDFSATNTSRFYRSVLIP